MIENVYALDESLKLGSRGHEETGRREAVSDVGVALISNPSNFRHGKQQILTVKLCQDFMATFSQAGLIMHQSLLAKECLEDPGLNANIFG